MLQVAHNQTPWIVPLQRLLRELGITFVVSLVLSLGLMLYLSSPP